MHQLLPAHFMCEFGILILLGALILLILLTNLSTQTYTVKEKLLTFKDLHNDDYYQYTPNRIKYVDKGTYYDHTAGVCKHFVTKGNGLVAGVTVSQNGTDGATQSGTYTCPGTDMSLFSARPPIG
jgi:hypothetical protein